MEIMASKADISLPNVEFTPKLIAKLKRDYAAAVELKQESFELMPGRMIYTKFAALVIARLAVGKTTVLGMRERGGRTYAKVTPIRSLQNVTDEIVANVELGSQIYTDDHVLFQDLDGLFYKHEAVNHSTGEYKRGAAHTNNMESVWAVMKRGLHGVYHHASAKHLFRYVDEFAWRLNEGDVKRHTLRRLDSFIDAIVGKRLTYKRLIGVPV
jgi:ISXO2-like transposase domain